MNTKSFVNQLDADNVVKGYYDESDQLVMVEPEGSGGGGGVETVSFNFRTSITGIALHLVRFSDEFNAVVSDESNILPSVTATITVVKGSVVFIDPFEETNTITVTEGTAEIYEYGAFKVETECTIEVS